MMLSSSINLLGKSRNKKVEFDLGKEQDNNFIPTKATDPRGFDGQLGYISKVQTPVLNLQTLDAMLVNQAIQKRQREVGYIW